MANKLVAVGQSTIDVVSNDALTWATDGIGGADSWRVIFHDGTRFIAAGRFGDLRTSTDGDVWTVPTISGDWGDNVNGLVWAESLGLFIAGGEGSTTRKIRTSPDLSVWSVAHSYSTFAFIRPVIWAESIGMAVVGDTDGKILSSPDAVTWTQRVAAGGSPRTLNKGLWADDLGLFVIAGENGLIRTSPDGITWASQTVAHFGTDDIWAIAYSPDLGLLVIAGDGGKIATSPDAFTWTGRTSPFGASRVSGGTWDDNNGLFVLVDGTDGDIATSPDGITWTDRSSPVTFGLNAVAAALLPDASRWQVGVLPMPVT